MSILILGGGMSGITTSILNPGSVLYEASNRLGGLSKSRFKDGYTFDQGPHIMFSRDQDILQLMIETLGSNVHVCKRNNVVMLDGFICKYPIENDLAGLPKQLRAEVLNDFVLAMNAKNSPISKNLTNLEEWFLANFGKKLTELYFKPYNEKVWNVPFEKLSMTWAERIPNPPLIDVIKGSMGIETEGYLHQLYYHYPKKGGYEALVQAWTKKIPKNSVHLDSKLTKLRILGKEKFELTFQNKTFLHNGPIVSTIPISELIKSLDVKPDWVTESNQILKVNDLITVNLAFDFEDSNQFTAIYIPDKHYLVNRISFPGVFSPLNLPNSGKTLIQCEITVSKEDEISELSDEFLVEHVMEGLVSRRIIPDDAPSTFVYVDRIPDAYVVYTENYIEKLNLLMNYFEKFGIHLNGRLGSHAYLNVDGILKQSIELAKKFNPSINSDYIRKCFFSGTQS